MSDDDDSAMWMDYFAEKPPMQWCPECQRSLAHAPGCPAGEEPEDDEYCACCKPLASEQEQRNGVFDACL